MALFGRKMSPFSVSEGEMKAHQKGYRNKELKEGKYGAENEREKRGKKRKVKERTNPFPIWQAQ